MFSRTNIEDKLLKYREERIQEQDIIDEVYRIFSDNETERNHIRNKLSKAPTTSENKLNIDLLEAEHIFHISEIEKICNTYRLRFLDSKFFKGEIPEEAISKIRELENSHHTSLENFKIVAPAKLMKMENADDPLLFASMGNDYYYLIHKWGRDLHPLRKWMMWPFRSLENIVITLAGISAFITSLLPLHLFTPNLGVGEYLFTFMYTFTALGGLAILWGVSKGKNFNGMIWRSKYYNG